MADGRLIPRILLDARKLGDSGIGVYIENLVEGFLKLKQRDPEALDLKILAAPPAAVSDGESAVAEMTRKQLERWRDSVEIFVEPAPKYSFDEYFRLAGRQRSLLETVHVFHSPHYTLPFFLRVPSVVTIHDVIHVSRPERFYHGPVGRLLIRSAVRRAAHVITVSGASLVRLKKLVGPYTPPVTVIPNALRDGIGVLPRASVEEYVGQHALSRPYYVFVGSDRPHKGFRELIGAWALVKAQCLRMDWPVPKLLAVGSRYSEATKRAAEECGLRDVVQFAGEISAVDLALLYNGSRGVVVPSKEEGFGLMALEALACGVPVICTPEQSLREVCGNFAWYSEDFTAEALAQAIFASYANPDMSEAKANRGIVRAHDFERECVAERTLEVYCQVIAAAAGAGRYGESAPEEQPQGQLYGGREVYDEHLRKAL